MYNAYTSQELNNLRSVFLTIKKKINEILANHDDINYLDDPSIDVFIIAKEAGIAGILFVPPETINYNHAVLEKTAKDRYIIKVNKNISKVDQLFSIAHEIEHYIKKKADTLKKNKIFIKHDVLINTDVLKNTNALADRIVARNSISNYKEAIRDVKKIKGSKTIANYISETVSKNLGKYVSIEQAYKELAKLLFRDNNKRKNYHEQYILDAMICMLQQRKNEQFIINMINKLYDEEMADYFAANLLVPTERFILWENKSDSKIAKAFKVPRTCIKKRREEIKHELEFITPENISFGDTKIV